MQPNVYAHAILVTFSFVVCHHSWMIFAEKGREKEREAGRETEKGRFSGDFGLAVLGRFDIVRKHQ